MKKEVREEDANRALSGHIYFKSGGDTAAVNHAGGLRKKTTT